MGIEAVTETGMPVNFTATGSLKGAGKLLGVACSVGGTTLTVATKTAAGTAVNLMNGVTLEAGRFYPLPFEFFGDCTFTLGGAADITVAWRRA